MGAARRKRRLGSVPLVPPGLVSDRRTGYKNVEPIAVADLQNYQLHDFMWGFDRPDSRIDEALWVEALRRGLVRKKGFALHHVNAVAFVVQKILAVPPQINQRNGEVDEHLKAEALWAREIVERVPHYDRYRPTNDMQAFLWDLERDHDSRTARAAKILEAWRLADEARSRSHIEIGRLIGAKASDVKRWISEGFRQRMQARLAAREAEQRLIQRKESAEADVKPPIEFNSKAEMLAYIRSRLSDRAGPCPRPRRQIITQGSGAAAVAGAETCPKPPLDPISSRRHSRSFGNRTDMISFIRERLKSGATGPPQSVK